MPEITPPQSDTAPSLTLADAVAIVFVAFAMTVVLSASWGRWLDPILDVGRDLYIPEKLVEGKQLYRDFQYQFPPVAPYLLALGTLAVGSDLSGYTAMGCTIGAAVALALFFLLRRVAGRAAAFTGAMLFVTLNLTAASNWGSNFIFPYAHAATIGTMFVLLHLLFMSRYLFGRRLQLDFWAGFACGVLAAGCKLEFAMFFGASYLYVLLFQRIPRKLVIASLICLLGLFAGSWAVFGGGPANHDWLRSNILFLVDQPRFEAFYATVTGTNQIRTNVFKSLHGVAIVLAFAGLLAAVTRTAATSGRGKWVGIALISVVLAALCIYGSDYLFFRSWSLLQIALVPLALRHPRSPLAFLLIASLLSSFRIFLNLTPAWYGFFLMVPVYVLILYVLFELVPAYGIYSRRVALAWMPLLFLLMFRSQLQQREIWSHCVYPVETRRGTYLDWNLDRAAAIQEFVLVARDARSLVVIPESPTLNYFAKVDNPLWNQMFTPHFSGFDWIERDMIAGFEMKKPEYVALVSRPVDEFGYRGFGIDYDRRLATYIGSKYRVAHEWQRPHFSLVLARRIGN